MANSITKGWGATITAAQQDSVVSPSSSSSKGWPACQKASAKKISHEGKDCTLITVSFIAEKCGQFDNASPSTNGMLMATKWLGEGWAEVTGLSGTPLGKLLADQDSCTGVACITGGLGLVLVPEVAAAIKAQKAKDKLAKKQTV